MGYRNAATAESPPTNLLSLKPLQWIAGTIKNVQGGHVPDAAYRRRTLRQARAAGTTCVPLLVRALCSADEPVARWGYFLLSRLTRPASCLDRVVQQIHALLADSTVADGSKALALSLLAELRVSPPAEITLSDPDAVIARSVRDLVADLKTGIDFDQAADLVLAQVASPELGQFCGELLAHGGKRAVRLVRRIRNQAEPEATAEIDRHLREYAPGRRLRRGWRQSAASSSERHGSPLEQALAALEAGNLRGAIRLMRTFVEQHPEDATARSLLGLCLLDHDEPGAAITELEAACQLVPTCALHHWNLAAAAQRAGRIGRCYLALRAYLATEDPDPDAGERRAEAGTYMSDYERAAQGDHPGADPVRLAQAEELFVSAYERMQAGSALEAASGFEQVLRLLPDHYPSWGNLGAAYLELEMRAQAIECYRRALELAPDYDIARKSLEQLE